MLRRSRVARLLAVASLCLAVGARGVANANASARSAAGIRFDTPRTRTRTPTPTPNPTRSIHRHHNGKPYRFQIGTVHLEKRVVRKNVTRTVNVTLHGRQVLMSASHARALRQRQQRG